MRLYELQKSRKKKVQVPFDPIEDARSSLEWIKERGITVVPNNTLQLFVPRTIERFHTKKEREEHVLRDKAKYAYDDEGNMISYYKNWVNNVQEAAPIIAGGGSPKPGDTKPLGALLWTSTAKKLPDGKWTSDWNKFVQTGNASGKPNNIGYVYKVLPRTSVYELDSTQDARYIYKIFATLGRRNTALTDPAQWERTREIFKGLDFSENEIEMNLMRKDFPWDEIAKHFDCVHHWGRHYSTFNYQDFTSSYDVESTVWFKPNQLELLGQVPLLTGDEREDDED